MPWLVLDLALVLVALVVLLLSGLSAWRAVKGLSREVAAAGTTIAAATDELARRQAEGAALAAAPAPPAGPEPRRLPVTPRRRA